MPLSPCPTVRTGDRSPARLLAVTLLLAVFSTTMLPAIALAQPLDRRIKALIADAKLGVDARVGVSVTDVRTGERLIAIDADDSFIPASNQKLLTTGAALAVLRPEFAFRTELILSTDGRLVIKGSGDPALADPEILRRAEPPLTVESLLTALAGAVTRIAPDGIGEIVVDDRVFDRQWSHPMWPAEQLHKHYACQVAGLNFHANVLSFFAAPGRSPGSAARFTLEPDASWIRREVIVRARTVGSGRNTPWVARHPTEDRFTLMGNVRLPSQVAARVALHESALLAGRLLADRLEAMDLQVGPTRGRIDGVRLATPNEPLMQGQTIAVITTPIADVLERTNEDSVNLYAEALLKRLGHEVTGEPGSWDNGASIMRMVVSERLGPYAASGISISDGSGLSRGNSVTPAIMTDWLANLARDPELSQPFLDSMPTIGVGTLRNRFRTVDVESRVLAKSGTINGVRCLSGYLIDDASGRTLAFSILVNDLPLAGGAGVNALRLHERIVAAIDDTVFASSRETALGG